MQKLIDIYTQRFKSQSLGNTYFYGLRWRQIQGPPRAAHTLATPLPGAPYNLHPPWFT